MIKCIGKAGSQICDVLIADTNKLNNELPSLFFRFFGNVEVIMYPLGRFVSTRLQEKRCRAYFTCMSHRSIPRTIDHNQRGNAYSRPRYTVKNGTSPAGFCGLPHGAGLVTYNSSQLNPLFYKYYIQLNKIVIFCTFISFSV